MKTTDQIAAEAADKFCETHTHITTKSAKSDLTLAFKAAIEKAVQDYDERICNHIISMIERLSARERKPFRAAQASECDHVWDTAVEPDPRAGETICINCGERKIRRAEQAGEGNCF